MNEDGGNSGKNRTRDGNRKQRVKIFKWRATNNVTVIPHKFEGIFIIRGVFNGLATLNPDYGIALHGERLINFREELGTRVQYRLWDLHRSKLAAAIQGGIEDIFIAPGTTVLHLGAGAKSGVTLAHLSDIVGPKGLVYAVENSQEPGVNLVNKAHLRKNIIPIIEDASHPLKYSSLMVGLVDTIYANVGGPDHIKTVADNALHYLKAGGHFLIVLKAVSTQPTDNIKALYAEQIREMIAHRMKPKELITLEPFKNQAMVVGVYRPPSKLG